MQACLQDLDQIMEEQDKAADRNMDRLLWQQGILMLLLILCVLFITYMNNRTLIHPLLNAVDRIKSDSPLQVRGAREFRYLARTYNEVYDINQDQAEQLAYDASHDKLTGLSNRNSFDLVMDGIKIPDYALLLIDVDNFKQINDHKGHYVGDRALCTVGEVLRKSFRDKDYVFRIGGDEFAVILQHVTADLNTMIKEKICMINKKLQTLENVDLRTTISAGVTFSGKNETPITLYRQADNALYEAKKNGRRCCAFYGQPASN